MLQPPLPPRSDENPRALRQVRAAQMRARAIRWGIGKTLLGTTFLIGALAHALGPQRFVPSTRVWMAFLVILSTLHVGLGLRTFSRVYRRALRWWWAAAAMWGILSVVLLRMLTGR